MFAQGAAGMAYYQAIVPGLALVSDPLLDALRVKHVMAVVYLSQHLSVFKVLKADAAGVCRGASLVGVLEDSARG